MPKYWGKNIFAHGSFPKVGQKQKKEKKKKKKKVGILSYILHPKHILYPVSFFHILYIVLPLVYLRYIKSICKLKI